MNNLYIADELVFVDNLEKYCKQLPTLRVLLSRLKIFLVKDPLLNPKEENFTEEDIFKESFMFQSDMETHEIEKELHTVKEHFCQVSLKDAESLMLPVMLESNKSNNFREKAEIPSCLELKNVLNLTPEDIVNESTGKVSYTLCPQNELEITLTPPCKSQRSQLNSLCAGLQAEPISPVSNSILITESNKEYLECLVWQSEKYQNAMNSLLLEEHPAAEHTCQHCSVTELKKLLSVKVETLVFSPLKADWWLYSGLNLVSPDILEQLVNIDLTSANSLLPTQVETFSRITSTQLERLLEENNSISNQGLFSAGAHHKDKTTNLHFTPQKKNQCSPLHMKAAQCGVIHDVSIPAEKLTREEIEQNKTERPTHFLNQEKEDKNNLESLSCKEVSFEPNSSSRNERNIPAELTRKCDDGSDLLSNFIMLRSKHVLIENEEKNNVAGQKQVLEIEEERSQILKQDIPAACKAVLKKKPEQETQDRVSIQVQASEGQCQAYHILAAAATPVLKVLMDLGMLASESWRFAAIKFDHTRFFLRQQEKVICDDFKQGRIDKELKLFKHAAQIHLLVTVRDLLLMCELDRALGYLSKAKDIYKSIFGSCLDNIWRQLEIIQFSRQKKHETNPKLIALHHHMLNWMQSNTEEQDHKVLIITRMDSDSEKAALIDMLTSIEGKCCMCVFLCIIVKTSKLFPSLIFLISLSTSHPTCLLSYMYIILPSILFSTPVSVPPLTLLVLRTAYQGLLSVILFKTHFSHKMFLGWSAHHPHHAILLNCSFLFCLKTMDLNPEKRGALLECKSVISSLNKCSCAIVNYQHIRADFPWTHFSLVVEFDYTENSCWNKLCKNLNIPYITFKTTLPETVVMKNVSGNHFGSFLLETQIPYVLFTSEGLLNSPEILQLLESKHKITFVERCCSESLQLFGDTDRYVVLTIDEHTAIVLQNVEELSCEKSADNIILRLIALSLQYSCCWIILYSRERLSSEYSLTGKTLHHLALIYAGLISFAQKSEDFEVKMALAPGIEETALLIRQIANNILVSSQTNPHEWLDRSWLSVLPTEAEKHLLAFPCLNPLVAQLMLKRGYSLNRLLSATFDQLQELLPEVPEKVLKLFSDITSLHNLNSSIPTTTLVRTVSPQENWNVSNTFSPASFPKSLISSIQGNQKDQCSELPDNVQNTINQSWDFYKNRSGSPLKSSESQRILASSLPYYGWVSCPEETDGSENSQHYLPSLRYVATERAVSPSFLKQNNSNIFTPSVHVNYEARIPPLSHSQDVTDSNFSSYLQKDFHASNAAVGSKLVTSDSSVLPKNSEAFVHQDINNHLFHVQTQPLTMHCNSDQASKQEWYLVSKKDDFFANFNEFPFQRSSKNFLEKFAGMADSSAGVQYKGSLWPEYPYDHTLDSSAPDFSLCDSFANPNEQKNLNFYPKARESSRKRRPGESLLNLKEKDVLTGLGLVQVPQLKKKRLTFEKVPGRSDGQTRLKFF
ncbi:PREDICTED: uncharacterized protein C9orf84 homolog [Crocodylus porosus]|uniref:uncharacterized protein C9orf84 homolog n=1 Tax=Crocodylus porosus TaxID=8502 RepID=UPI00093B87C9|nr:PREDICTED: uncharacterized protein C9orf84 homolog [Crocodylus porosus]